MLATITLTTAYMTTDGSTMLSLPTALSALSAFETRGAWLVGGAVRDALAGDEHSSRDWDIVATDGERWARQAADALSLPLVKISSNHDVWRIVLADGQIDIWPLPDRDIEHDLSRRDFSVNAMAVPLDQLHNPFRVGEQINEIAANLIDPFGGRRDLAARRLRLVSDSAFRDDPIRMLRAVRLEAEGGWRPDGNVRAAMRRDATLIGRSAAERQWDELQRILLSVRLPWALRRLQQSRLLDNIFPELAACRGVDQRPVHRRDVYWHQLDALRWLAQLDGQLDVELEGQRGAQRPLRAVRSATLNRELQPLLKSREVAARLREWRLPLRLATLLHDIGKPGTRQTDAGGATRFFGHSELGAELAEQRLRQLRLPSRLIDQITLLITHHLRPGQVHSPGSTPTDRALHRFHLALGDAATPLCWLFLVDSLATVGADVLLPRWPDYVRHVARIVAWQPRQPRAASHLLNGREIMAATGIAPGPLVGQLRDRIDEAAAVGDVTDTQEARDLACRLVMRLTSTPSTEHQSTEHQNGSTYT